MIVGAEQGVPVDDLVHRPTVYGYTRVPGYRKATPEDVDTFLFGIGPIRMGDKRVFELIEDEL